MVIRANLLFVGLLSWMQDSQSTFENIFVGEEACDWCVRHVGCPRRFSLDSTKVGSPNPKLNYSTSFEKSMWWRCCGWQQRFSLKSYYLSAWWIMEVWIVEYAYYQLCRGPVETPPTPPLYLHLPDGSRRSGSCFTSGKENKRESGSDVRHHPFMQELHRFSLLHLKRNEEW